MRECAHHIHIANHKSWLVEYANHILVAIHIHSVLATHAGIHLPQERSGYKAKLHTSHIGGSHKTRYVGHNASANAEDKCRAVSLQFNQTAVYHIERVNGLARFAQTNQDVVVLRYQRVVVAVDIGVGDNDYSFIGQMLRKQLSNISNQDFTLVFYLYCIIHNNFGLNSRTKVVHFCDFY